MAEKQMLRTSLPIWQLQPHPNNVRKSVGDISELADSIRAQGVMQNLLVVPVPGNEKDAFWVVIGNRRLAAAEAAGLDKLPCTVAFGLSDQEQLELMLVENLQRRDLTPQEEAQAYEQLTLDFGLSADQIAEKTGVSASTIRRRLKINELDPETINKKEFQLSLGDYAALEKIKDKDKKNQVLENAESSANLHYLADLAAEQEERRESIKPLIGFIRQLYDVEIVDRKGPDFRYFGSLFIADDIETSKQNICAMDIQCYDKIYLDATAGVTYLYGHSIVENDAGGSGKTVTRAELLEQKRERDHKFALKRCREMAEERQEFIIRVINGEFKLPAGTTPQEAQERLWAVLRGIGSPTMEIRALTAYWTRCELYQVFDNDKELMAEKPMWIQMLAAAGYSTRRSDYLCSYGGQYHQESGETLQRLVGFLRSLGFSLRDQEQQMVLEGSHDCWEQKK